MMLLCIASLALAARFLLIGDTGDAVVEEARAVLDGKLPACGARDTREACEVAQLLTSVTARVSNSGVDAVLVLGDNYYGDFPGIEPAPRCAAPGPGVSSRWMANFHGVVARYDAVFGALAPVPIYGVLGNHDVGHSLIPHWKQTRTCSESAMAAVGWTPPRGIGTVSVGGGLVRLLDTNRVLASPAESDHAAALVDRGAASWELWVGHHAWSLVHEKGKQPEKLRRILSKWKRRPDAMRPTIWVNGHAHHQEAVLQEGVLAITSGSGSKDRALKPKRVDPPDEKLYDSPGRGYTVLDIQESPVRADACAYGPDDTLLGSTSCTWRGTWKCTAPSRDVCLGARQEQPPDEGVPKP